MNWDNTDKAEKLANIIRNDTLLKVFTKKSIRILSDKHNCSEPVANNGQKPRRVESMAINILLDSKEFVKIGRFNNDIVYNRVDAYNKVRKLRVTYTK